jgi:acetyl esterase/lipase
VIVGLGALVAGCTTQGGGEPVGDGSADPAASSVVSETSPAASDPATSPPTAVEPECREAATGPTTFAYADRPGVDPNLTSVDVYLPAGCGPVPVVMWVHGGGWRRGDKAGAQVERKAAWAESLGAALVSVNYRLSTPESGVRWPDHGEDVAAAVAWVQAEGATIGLDPDRLVLVGHSAGAHLVSIVGTDPSLLTGAGADPVGVDCVVALDVDYDLADAAGQALIANAFGTDPDVLAAASPPIQVGRNGAPSASFFVVTRGGPPRIAKAQGFRDVINDSGGTAQLLDATGYSHAEVSSQLGAPADTLVTPPVTDFVRSCLVG